MTKPGLASLQAEIAMLDVVRVVGRVCAVEGNLLRVAGFADEARLGDRVRIYRRDGGCLTGEVLQMDQAAVVVLPDEAAQGVALGDRVSLSQAASVAPDDSWVGRIIDPYGQPLDVYRKTAAHLERRLHAVAEKLKIELERSEDNENSHR